MLTILKRNKTGIARLAFFVVLFLIFKMVADIQSVPQNLNTFLGPVQKVQLLDRYGTPLTMTHENKWNTSDSVVLNEIPSFLQNAFIMSEDKRFFDHSGVDYQARFHALWQNLFERRFVRGGSTISEQVVKMIHPRSRSLWTKVIEGFEAQNLEWYNNKLLILEFYLNQVPYAGNRRGVKQAALYYFNRDLETLSPKEMLALAVLVRAPSSYDLYRFPEKIDPLILNLAKKMKSNGFLDSRMFEKIKSDAPLALMPTTLTLKAPHFARMVLDQIEEQQKSGKIYTTLDGPLQTFVQKALENRLEDLTDFKVKNGAVVVLDNITHEILTWNVKGDEATKDFNAVLIPRQTGSTLKPFLYSLALDKKIITAATLIEDRPFIKKVGSGLHQYKNYSEKFYGAIPMREALGNSLNIPAVRTLEKVGVSDYLHFLKEKLSVENLTENAEFYGEGLALGSIEIPLLKMTELYSLFASEGNLISVTPFLQTHPEKSQHVFSEEASTLLAHILSDPFARAKEFGMYSVLNFNSPVAVKTGTSNDYHDAWVFAFDRGYTVGIWMGNLSRESTNGLTGGKGPALLARTIFNELHKRTPDVRGLPFSPRLQKVNICWEAGQVVQATKKCVSKEEYFLAGTTPTKDLEKKESRSGYWRLMKPTSDLKIAIDKRVPLEHQAFKFEFQKEGHPKGNAFQWILDGKIIAQTEKPSYTWSLKSGKHVLLVKILNNSVILEITQPIPFFVQE
ncbi:MAG: transglycosylase domain-containing protein [Alphaproteobacteria bacterium]|nr:transglycosylase domain-containing protein [Alphaproteobacteria bacterium]